MPRGRKPKPVEQRRREGNPGKRALPRPILVSPGALDRPKGLPEEAIEAWDDVVPALAAVGIIDRIDRMALEALVMQYARMVQARAGILEDGLTIEGERGKVVNPSVLIERQAAAALLKLAESYGLTPIARVRLGLAELKRRSLGQELLAQHDTATARPPEENLE